MFPGQIRRPFVFCTSSPVTRSSRKENVMKKKEYSLPINLNPVCKKDLIRSANEIRTALAMVKEAQLAGDKAAAKRVIDVIALSVFVNPFGEDIRTLGEGKKQSGKSGDTSSSSASLCGINGGYDRQNYLVHVVRDHTSALVSSNIASDCMLDDVMQSVIAALCSGKLLLRNLPDLELKAKKAEEEGDLEAAMRWKKEAEAKKKQILAKDPINAVANYISFNGSKAGDAEMDTLFNGHTVRRRASEKAYQYKLPEESAGILIAQLDLRGIPHHEVIAKDGSTLVYVPAEAFEKVIAEEDGDSGLVTIQMRGIKMTAPAWDYEKDKPRYESVYLTSGSTTVTTADGEESEVSLVDLGEAINAARIRTPEEMLVDSIGDEEAVMVAELIYSRVMDKIAARHFSSRDFKAFCIDSDGSTVVSPKYRDASAIMTMLHTGHVKMFRDIKAEIEAAGRLSERVEKALDQAIGCWNGKNENRNTLSARGMILGAVAYGARNEF